MGSPAAGVEFSEWYEAGGSPEEKPGFSEGEFGALVLTVGGQLFKYFHRLNPVEVHDEFIAVGTADAVAYGAMDAGATPEEAVKIACRRDVYTGEPVVVERR